MSHILSASILIGSLFLFGISFVKICIMDEDWQLHKISAMLYIVASTSFIGRVLFPKLVNMAWLKLAILALIIGVLLWIFGERREARHDVQTR